MTEPSGTSSRNTLENNPFLQENLITNENINLSLDCIALHTRSKTQCPSFNSFNNDYEYK